MKQKLAENMQKKLKIKNKHLLKINLVNKITSTK